MFYVALPIATLWTCTRACSHAACILVACCLQLDPETITKHTSDVLRDMIERLRQHQVSHVCSCMHVLLSETEAYVCSH